MRKLWLLLFIVCFFAFSGGSSFGASLVTGDYENIYASFLLKDYKTALEQVNTRLKIYPRDANLFAFKAIFCSILLGETNNLDYFYKMHDALDECLKLEPKNFIGLYMKGAASILTPPAYGGDIKEGIEVLKQALEIYQRRYLKAEDIVIESIYVYAQYTLGLAYLESGDEKTAQNYFEKAAAASWLDMEIIAESQGLSDTLSGSLEGFTIKEIVTQGARETAPLYLSSLLSCKKGEKYSALTRQNCEKNLLRSGLFLRTLVYAQKAGKREVKVVIKVEEKPNFGWWPYPVFVGFSNLRGWGHKSFFSLIYLPNEDKDCPHDNLYSEGGYLLPLNLNSSLSFRLKYSQEKYQTKVKTGLGKSAYGLNSFQVGLSLGSENSNNFGVEVFTDACLAQVDDLKTSSGEVFFVPSGDPVIYAVGGRIFNSKIGKVTLAKNISTASGIDYLEFSFKSRFEREYLPARAALRVEGDFLEGTIPHFKMASLGGFNRLRGYSQLDLRGNRVLFSGLSCAYPLASYFMNMMDLQGELFAETGLLSLPGEDFGPNSNFSDLGAALNLYAFPKDMLWFTLYFAVNDRNRGILGWQFSSRGF